MPTFLHGTAWMNWAMLAAAAVSIPIFVLFPQEQKRLAVDSGQTT
jgi:ABC-type maltose transport system permease subunit